MDKTYYVLAVVACTLLQCYKQRLYTEEHFATKEECEKPRMIMFELHPVGTSLEVRCMRNDKWEKLPEYVYSK